jgi:hypothetical protein
MKSKIINFPKKPVGAVRTFVSLILTPFMTVAAAIYMIGGIVLALPYATLISMNHVLDRYFESGT